jgi:hypothetical protein
MARLSLMHGENNLFVSQYDDNDVDQASVFISLIKGTENGDEYLKLRRLLRALEYRFNHESKDYEIKVSIERKAGK